MKMHEIDMVGKFWTQRAASLPSWGAADEGRVIYDDANNLLYYGNNAAWQRITIGDPAIYALKASANNWTASQLPNADNTYTLGNGSYRWNNVYSVTFTGTVTTATYADLAEMYKTAVHYPVGTLVKISEKEGYDVELAEEGDDVLGVISSKPGFILNFDKNTAKTMQPIGLTGRVPVRVVGPIKKGQAIMAAGKGLACACSDRSLRIGWSLTTNSEEPEKLVECTIK
jgi:hypothetical protein